MLKPRARLAIARPMRPKPTIPSVLLLAWVPSSGTARPQPSRMTAENSLIRRHAFSSRVKARSAVQSVSTSGVLVTTRPRALAAATSIWSKPTLQVAATFTLGGSLAMAAASSFM